MLKHPPLKVLIIGAGGRLGAALTRRYQTSYQVTAYRRNDLDILRPDTFHSALEANDFDVLIYCAGLTNVDYCEDHPVEADLANHVAPATLAEICRAKGARMLHISTDYVFDGRHNRTLSETEVPNPVCVYGHSKLHGEEAVLAHSADFLVIRISWLFGPDRPSFPDLILKNALEKDQVSAIADKVSCPTYSEDLALWFEPMLCDERYRGLLHLSNMGSTTWQSYGQTTLDIAAELGLPIKARKVNALFRSDFPIFKAQRPEFTAFDTSKFIQLANFTPRPWQEALREYLRHQYC